MSYELKVVLTGLVIGGGFLYMLFFVTPIPTDEGHERGLWAQRCVERYGRGQVPTPEHINACAESAVKLYPKEE